MKRGFLLSLFTFSFATSFAMAADVSGGDVEIVLKRAPKSLTERKFLARRDVAQARTVAQTREQMQTRAVSQTDDDLAESSLQFTNVPRVYVNGATLAACEARYRDFMKRLTISKVVVLQANRCQRVIAPVQTADTTALVYQGIIDFIK